MLIRAAADSAALKAVVVEGASGQSVRDGLTNGDRFDALLGGAVNTAAVAVFTNNLPPPSLKSQVSRIAPNSVFFIFGEHGEGGTDKSPNQQISCGSPRTEADLAGPGRAAHRRHHDAARRVRATRNRLLRRSAPTGTLNRVTRQVASPVRSRAVTSR
jgi:hypothetical protein